MAVLSKTVLALVVLPVIYAWIKQREMEYLRI
jgi:hypothetical protein